MELKYYIAKHGLLGVKQLQRSLAFFGGKISPKKGQKCCRYGQNGKPMTVQKAEELFKELEQYISGWKMNEDRSTQTRHFYAKEYLTLHNFVNEVVGVDQQTTRNRPEFHITRGDLLKVVFFEK